LREHAFFHDQLRAGGEPRAAVALIDAAPVGAQQAARNLGWLGCFQADHWLELRGQRPAGQVLQQRGGRSGVHSGAGQDPAQVLDHIRPGPGTSILLRQGNRLLRRA
jgi:glycine/D-amino acid oxidase-like deaminating enzyme